MDATRQLVPVTFAADELIGDDFTPAAAFARADGSGVEVWHLPLSENEIIVSRSGTFILWQEPFGDMFSGSKKLHFLDRASGVDRVIGSGADIRPLSLSLGQWPRAGPGFVWLAGN